MPSRRHFYTAPLELHASILSVATLAARLQSSILPCFHIVVPGARLQSFRAPFLHTCTLKHLQRASRPLFIRTCKSKRLPPPIATRSAAAPTVLAQPCCLRCIKRINIDFWPHCDLRRNRKCTYCSHMHKPCEMVSTRHSTRWLDADIAPVKIL